MAKKIDRGGLISNNYREAILAKRGPALLKQDFNEKQRHSPETATQCRETLHEVKNKLHFILNNYEYMEDNISLCSQGLTAEFKEIIRENHQGLMEAMVMLVRTLDDSTAGEDKRKFNPEETLEDILRSLGSQLKGIVLKKEINHGDYRIIGSEENLKLILSNLIGNSVQCFQTDYTWEKSIAVGISQNDSNFIVFTVADNGPGIPRENLDRIFDSGFSTRKASGGSGQGLAIVKKLVEKEFGGRISLSSEPGKGTEFVFEIPMAREEVERG